MNRKKFRIWLIFLLVWLAVIFGHSAMPAEVSRKESLGIFAWLQLCFPWLTHTLLRKLGHMTEFAILGVLLTGCFFRAGKRRLYLPLASAMLVALCDETLQLFIPGRSGEIRDVWIDLGGALLGVLLTRLLLRRKTK